MARFPLSVTILFCLALLADGAAPTVAAARPAHEHALAPAGWTRPGGIGERLAVDGSSQQQQQCWETLLQIKSCTGEIILFFLEGEVYLGSGCCHALRAFEQRCWAADAVLSIVGFTPQEGDMLKKFCNAGDDEADSQGQQQQQGASPPPRGAAFALDSFAGRKHGAVHG